MQDNRIIQSTTAAVACIRWGLRLGTRPQQKKINSTFSFRKTVLSGSEQLFQCSWTRRTNLADVIYSRTV